MRNEEGSVYTVHEDGIGVLPNAYIIIVDSSNSTNCGGGTIAYAAPCQLHPFTDRLRHQQLDTVIGYHPLIKALADDLNLLLSIPVILTYERGRLFEIAFGFYFTSVKCSEVINLYFQTVKLFTVYFALVDSEKYINLRPIIGIINFCPDKLNAANLDIPLMASTATHEITHALGFTPANFALMRDENGNPRTPRDSQSDTPIKIDTKSGFFIPR
ncbi:unnamed protein product [Trichobilharzia regenti]|nr:unnamed protein product [Trichobilharzia regenti]